MSITNDEIDRYYGRKVRITFDDGSQKKGFLKGKRRLDNALGYDTITIFPKEKEDGIEFPVSVIQRINLDI